MLRRHRRSDQALLDTRLRLRHLDVHTAVREARGIHSPRVDDCDWHLRLSHHNLKLLKERIHVILFVARLRASGEEGESERGGSQGLRRCRFNRRGGTGRAAATLSPTLRRREVRAHVAQYCQCRGKAPEPRPAPSVLPLHKAVLSSPSAEEEPAYGAAGRRFETVSSRPRK